MTHESFKHPFDLSEVILGQPIRLDYFEGSTDHSFNSGRFTFTAKGFKERQMMYGGTTHYVVGTFDYGDNESFEAEIYTMNHVGDDDGPPYAETTLCKGSGCEPLFRTLETVQDYWNWAFPSNMPRYLPDEIGQMTAADGCGESCIALLRDARTLTQRCRDVSVAPVADMIEKQLRVFFYG